VCLQIVVRICAYRLMVSSSKEPIFLIGVRNSTAATTNENRPYKMVLNMDLSQLYLNEWVPSSGFGWVGILFSPRWSIPATAPATGHGLRRLLWSLPNLLLPKLLYSLNQIHSNSRSQPWRWFSVSHVAATRWIRRGLLVCFARMRRSTGTIWARPKKSCAVLFLDI
jgi:hypothetical protein